ncbi:hypothetical protein HYC85_000818 [Camellia sinensis]|uniref:Uncharacterized protein n=1 Tax=Camellia sinensis TaxID=4442 RepID=A0A7J7I3V2_CAMSI|nr:hypothetical protein HYC85_000818 [Camellia sinensis]
MVKISFIQFEWSRFSFLGSYPTLTSQTRLDSHMSQTSSLSFTLMLISKFETSFSLTPLPLIPTTPLSLPKLSLSRSLSNQALSVSTTITSSDFPLYSSIHIAPR